MFYLTTHTTHFIYKYMVRDMIFYMHHPTENVSTHHGLYCASRGTLAETRLNIRIMSIANREDEGAGGGGGDNNNMLGGGGDKQQYIINK